MMKTTLRMKNTSAPTLSDRFRHFFHLVSNIRPVVWIFLYLCMMPVFALIYWALPDTQFRIPDGSATDFGSWLYYSIVTITTLGFGDYTPAHGWAQAVTAIEVMIGLSVMGFFLNAVGSMKSELDISAELERQRKVHEAHEHKKLSNRIPVVLHTLNIYLSYCYAVSTPHKARGSQAPRYNPGFTLRDMADLYRPTALPLDGTSIPAVERLMKSAGSSSLCLDSLQNQVDLALWPDLMEECFGFVAAVQMFTCEESVRRWPAEKAGKDGVSHAQACDNISKLISEAGSSQAAPLPEFMDELYRFVKVTADHARHIGMLLTKVSTD